MISPLELILDPVSLTVFSIYAIMILWEHVFPARKLPKIKAWKIKGIIAFMLFFFISSYLPFTIDPYLARFTLFDLSSLGTAWGVLTGILLYELGIYGYHRMVHSNNFLWRSFHQIHHSAERLDTFGAFYFSPLDMIGFTVLGSVCFTLIMNLPPQSITILILSINFFSMFQHANIRTPRWIGYFIQRPESHSIHHGKGIHSFNYSDLPVFDIIFGTFQNPEKFENETGLFHGASARILEMLSFKDLTKRRSV